MIPWWWLIVAFGGGGFLVLLVWALCNISYNPDEDCPIDQKKGS